MSSPADPSAEYLDQLLACELLVGAAAKPQLARLTLAELDYVLADVQRDLDDAGATDASQWRAATAQQLHDYGRTFAGQVVADVLAPALTDIEERTRSGALQGYEVSAALQPLNAPDALLQRHPYATSLPPDLRPYFVGAVALAYSEASRPVVRALRDALALSDSKGRLDPRARETLGDRIRTARDRVNELRPPFVDRVDRLGLKDLLDNAATVSGLLEIQKVATRARRLRSQALGGEHGEQEILAALDGSPLMTARRRLREAEIAVEAIDETLAGLSLRELRDRHAAVTRERDERWSQHLETELIRADTSGHTRPLHRRIAGLESQLVEVGEQMGARDAYELCASAVRQASGEDESASWSLRPRARAKHLRTAVETLATILPKVLAAVPEAPRDPNVEALGKSTALNSAYEQGFRSTHSALVLALNEAITAGTQLDAHDLPDRARFRAALDKLKSLEPLVAAEPAPGSGFVSDDPTWDTVIDLAQDLAVERAETNLHAAIVARSKSLLRDEPATTPQRALDVEAELTVLARGAVPLTLDRSGEQQPTRDTGITR